MSYIRIFCVIILGFLASNIAQSQTDPDLNLPRENSFYDQNGIDLTTGKTLSVRGLTGIGHDQASLSVSMLQTNYEGYNPSRLNFRSGVFWVSGRGYVVTMGEAAEDFDIAQSSSFSTSNAFGSTLALSGGIYTYTTADGTVSTFDSAIRDDGFSNKALVTEITSPNGNKLKFDYIVTNSNGVLSTQLSSVRNSSGYQIKIQNNGKDYYAINNYYDYCSPTAVSCSINTNNYNKASYTPPSGSTSGSSTDENGDTTLFNSNQSTSPSGAQQNYTYQTFGSVERAISASFAGLTWNYAYSDSGNVRTVTVTAPDNGQRVVKSEIDTGLVISDKDAMGRTTSYTYDASDRLKTVTAPSGVQTEYSYDSRGNVTQTKLIPNGGGTPLISSATYPASCSNPKTCNKPTSTTNAAGQTTNYTYSSNHGGVLTVTNPEGSVMKYDYVQYRAKVKTASGSLVDSDPIWKVRRVRACPSAASCVGGADELVKEFTYNTNLNLKPVSTITRSGDNALSAQVIRGGDRWGNDVYIDGPLSGSVDRTYIYYQAKTRRMTGSISFDPDGGGPKSMIGMRYVYTDGQLTRTETGTVGAQSASALNSMTALRSQVFYYDNDGRPIKTVNKNGTTISAVRQTSYDAMGRPQCQAIRMNPGYFNNLPSNACNLGTLGSYGNDRITKVDYNQSGQVTDVTSGLGTAGALTVSREYFANGNLSALIDGEGNRTSYYYDSFNRNSQIRYPNTSGGGSNAADRELFSYDAYGRMTARRLRDDTLISTSYDSMNRPTFVNAPGTADDISYTYDRFGRTLTVSKNGSTITNAYDAFGRRISETSVNGTVSYEYDLAGRGTKITYPQNPGSSGFYIDYEYDYSGAITHIRENGATSGVGVLASYSYDSYGRRTGVTYGNGASTTYGYNSEYRLHGLTHNLNGTADDLSLNFTYAPTGQITSKVRTNNSYDFDEFANLGDEMTHNGLNQIIANDFGAVSYDARGNVTNAHGKTYGYDIWDNLTSVTGSGHNAALAYDAAGRLAQVTDNGTSTTTKFAYSGTQLIAEYNGAGTLLRRYVHGLSADEPIVWYEGSGTNDRRFLMKDHQGSVIAISNSQGDIIDKNSYSVYGQPDSQNIGRFGYTGQMWIAEAGLYHYKARAYDPSLRRFLQTDPIGYAAGMNIYAYVGGDPINFTDPSGMTAESCIENVTCGPTVISRIQRQWRPTYDPFADRLRNDAMRWVNEGFNRLLNGIGSSLSSYAQEVTIKAACAVGAAALQAARMAINPITGMLPDAGQAVGLTQVISGNLGLRGSYVQGTASLFYAESRRGSAVGFGMSGGMGYGQIRWDRPMTYTELRKAFVVGGFGTAGMGYTNAPVDVLTSTDTTSVKVGRAFYGAFGGSGAIINAGDSTYVYGAVEVGGGITLDIGIELLTKWFSCNEAT